MMSKPERTHNRNVRPQSGRLPVVEFKGQDDCPDCDGQGVIEADCEECNGTGTTDLEAFCRECNGHGTYDSDCETCEGTGKVDDDDSA